ncbi:MAG: hypothetical protein A2V93_03290 [Ignavibacteria bacterium RBG_16_34_14]|nr:MAG: hypothetical protein A2V93_03290 [Ignavibacteria bacterium RBG_16_34_14]
MQSNKNKIDEETLDRIISAAYKDAGLIERLKIYFLAKKNAGVKSIYNEYRTNADRVKKIPPEECPDSVIESLKIKTMKENKFFILKPAYVFIISLIVISTFIAVLLYQNKEKKPTYSRAEIELAEKQVKESLAIVNRIFKRTESLIQEEVLPKRVGKPIHKSLSIINEVLIGG